MSIEMNLESIKNNVIDLSERVALFIQQEAVDFSSDKIEYKGKNDLVSYVDKTAEQMIVSELDDLIPGAGFLAEEGATRNADAEWVWVIDPLDGTTNFIHSIPTYAISIGLLHQQEPVLGLVRELNRNECFHAVKGSGAYCNKKRIAVSNNNQFSGALLATGFPYHQFENMDQYLKILTEFMGNCHGIRRIGSAAVDLAYVAAGRFEGFFEYNLNPWDVAGGIVLVTEAGGKVTDFSNGNNALFGNEIIAANAIHPEMQQTIARYWQ
jgi:myo-inositol-1(or 4)-monophosphatase